MEESYHAAARRGTLQNILSYSLELKYLIIGHAAAVQGEILCLTSNMKTVSNLSWYRYHGLYQMQWCTSVKKCLYFHKKGAHKIAIVCMWTRELQSYEYVNFVNFSFSKVNVKWIICFIFWIIKQFSLLAKIMGGTWKN